MSYWFLKHKNAVLNWWSEPHIHAPLGGVIGRLWRHKISVLPGIRNKSRQGLSADETEDRNTFYYADGLNYVPNSCCQVVWRRLGHEHRRIDQETFDAYEHTFVRPVGRLNRVLVLIDWMSHTFYSRRVWLTKPALQPPGNEKAT